MCNYVLFSPIGATDPTRDGYDGPMLHIARNYKPRKIYLFLTAEMRAYEDNDRRQACMIEKLYDNEICERPEIIYIVRNIEDPSNYEIFYNEYRRCISEIHAANPDDIILLNVTSGTPQMQSALNALSLQFPFAIKSIQVKNPKQSSSHGRETYNPNVAWESLLDNNDDSRNRCVELENNDLYLMFAKENIKSHIENYDYQAAYITATAPKVIDSIDDALKKLLQCVMYKSMYNYTQANDLIFKTGANRNLIFPNTYDPDRRNIFEYILYMDNRRKRGEYMEFCRAVSPVFLELLYKIFEQLTNQRIDDIIDDNNGIRTYSLTTYESAPAQNLQTYIVTTLRDFSGQMLNSENLIRLINAHISLYDDIDANREIENLIDYIRDFEKSIRNKIAHQLVDMNNRNGDYSEQAERVLNNIKVLYSAVYGKEDHWDNYDKINEYIIEQL